MKRLGKNVFSTLLATVAAASLGACGGGSHAAVPQIAAANGASGYTGPVADATFAITIPPPPKTSSNARTPKYVSSSTSQIVFTLNSASRLTSAQLTSFSAGKFGSKPVTLGSGACPGSGPWTCTFTLQLPPGNDNLTISAQDSSNHVLSQQIQTFAVTAGGSASGVNKFSTTLDANAGTLSIAGSQPCESGTTIANGGSYGVVGTSMFTLPVTFTDPDGKTIVSPGLPTIEVLGNDSTYHTSTGTISGTGGTVGFSINQSAQTITFTPSNTGITGVSVNIKGVAPNASDGLTFNVSTSFTLAVGNAPPAHNFLAVVEQTGSGSGQVDFFNLGTDSGGPVSFSAFSPASLAATMSSNQSGQEDVDNPVSLAFDNNGDLLIGNADTTGGNFACVPAGAISTGANASTTVTTNVDDPVGLAYEPRNGTVAIGNAAPAPSNVAYNLAEFTLNGDYTPSSNDLLVSGAGGTAAGGPLTGNTINLPSLTAGTFAISITNGCEEDSAHRSNCSSAVNEVAIFGPTGSTTTISDPSNYHVDLPAGISYDSTNAQLLIGNTSNYHPSLSFYTTSGTYVKSLSNFYADYLGGPYLVAANGAGKFAIAYSTATSSSQVQVYTNASGATAPTTVYGPITYNETSDSTCAGSTGYYYGTSGSVVVNSLTWLSNTRLLVELQSDATNRNGLYIYDITTSMTPSGEYNDLGISCNPVGAQPAQKAFQQITNHPFAAAFKP